MICLVLERAGLVPAVMSFAQATVVVGRATGEPGAAPVDWSLAFPDVSRVQCRFTRIADRYYVEGLSPRTPTRVRGEAIAGITRIVPGDRVTFGGCVVRLGGGVEGEARVEGTAGTESRAGGGARAVATDKRRAQERSRGPDAPGAGGGAREVGTEAGVGGGVRAREVGTEAVAGSGGGAREVETEAPGRGVRGEAREAESCGLEDMSEVAAAARRWSELGQPVGSLLRGAALRRALAGVEGELGAEAALIRRFVATSATARGTRRRRALAWATAAGLAATAGTVAADSWIGPPLIVGRTAGGPGSRGCVPEALARADAAAGAAEAATDATARVLLAGLGLRVAGQGGCAEASRAEAVLRAALVAPRGWAVGTLAGPVRSLAARGDGRVVAAVDARGRVHVGEVLGGEAPAMLEGGEPATIVAFEAGGRWLAAGGVAGEVRVWDARGGLSGPGVRLAGHAAEITGLAFAGSALVSADARGELRLWRVVEGTGDEGDAAGGAGGGGFGEMVGGTGWAAVAVAPGDGAAVRELAFEPGAGRVVGLAGGRARSWRVAAGRLAPGPALGDAAEVTSVAWLAGALVTGDRAGAVRVWRAARGRWTSRVVTTHAAEVVGVRALAGREAVVSLGRDGELRLVELAAPVRGDGTPLVYAFARPEGGARALLVDASGTRALTVGAALRVWDVQARRGAPVMTLETSGEVSAAAGGGAWVTGVAADGSLRAWELRGDGAGAEGYPLAEQAAGWRALALAGRGSVAAVAGRDGALRTWRVDGDGVPTPDAGWRAGPIDRLALSADGRWLAGSSGEALRVWDLAAPDREPVALAGHVRAIAALQFAGRDAWLVSADPGELVAWRIAATGPEPIGLRAAAPAEIAALATSDGHVAVGTGDGRAYAWPLGEAWTPESLVAEHSRPVTALAFGSGGEALASGAADGGAQALTLADGRWRAARPYDHGRAITALAFGPGDAALAIGGADGAVAVIAPRGREAPRRLQAHAGAISGLVFGEEASRLVSASAAGELVVWRVAEEVEAVARIEHRGPLGALLGAGAGRLALVADDGAAIRVWPLDTGGLVRLGCAVAGRDLGADERRALAWASAQPLCGGGR